MASIVVGTNKNQGCVLDIVVGIIGAFIGSFIRSIFPLGFPPRSLLGTIVFSIIGAIIFLAVLQVFGPGQRRRRRRR